VRPVPLFIAPIYWVGDARRSHNSWDITAYRIVHLFVPTMAMPAVCDFSSRVFILCYIHFQLTVSIAISCTVVALWSLPSQLRVKC
jgi:hypothetical protein